MSTTSVPQSPVARFIRGTLGCQCPEDVLHSIAIETDCRDDSCRFIRITAGHRLLVYLVSMTDDCVPATLVAAMARRGREDRDFRGFNRFRLVLASDDATLFDRVASAFSMVAGNDERTHLHVVSSHDLPDLATQEPKSPIP